MVTVTYEQARGLRQVHQKPGGFEISVSRTVGAPIAKAYQAWTEERTRKKWLSAGVTIRKATTNKSLRLNWEDGTTIVAAAFLAKGDGKTQVVAQHNKLPDAKSATKMKTFWGDALDALKELIE